MKRKPKPKLSPEEQYKRFQETAKSIGTDVNADTLKRVVRQLAPGKKKSAKARKP